MSGYMESIPPAADERAGLPSASGLERLMLCPGSWQAEQAAPAEARSAKADRESSHGDKIHAALAGDKESLAALSPEELETYDACVSQVISLSESLGMEDAELHREQRLWLSGITRAGKPGPIFSGRFDLIAVKGDTALIVDFKTLYGEHASSEKNPQLRAGSVLAAIEYDVTRVFVAIVQPRLHREPLVCVYDSDPIESREDNKSSLEVAEIELRAALDTASKPGARRIPGEVQCRHCKAKMICPEAQASVAVAVNHPLSHIVAMTGPQLADFLDLCKLVRRIADAAETEAMCRLGRDPASVPGWGIGQTNPKRSIEGVRELYVRMASKYGTAPEAFSAICSTSIKDLKSLVSKELKRVGSTLERGSGGISGEANRLLDGLTKKGQPTRKLVKVGEALEEDNEE